jgi:hypothetical protein
MILDPRLATVRRVWNQIRRITLAEAFFAAVAVALIATFGTGLGVAASRLDGDSSPKRPLQIVRPVDDRPGLNRDRERFERRVVP